MKKELNYDFLKRMQVIHKPARRDSSAVLKSGEVELDSSWSIVIPESAGKVMRHAAGDFQDYLFTSMNVSVKLVAEETPAPGARRLVLSAGLDKKSGSFELNVTADKGITLTGADEKGVFRGTIYLEDTMNLREAPFLSAGVRSREPLARMLSIHSGCGIDQFPDWQLNAIAHAGFTAIDIFTKAPDTTTSGYCNINDVINRAANFGLDAVLYSYLSSYKHPDDSDAEEFFDSVYGEIFRRHPGFSAIHLVGESLQFPSKDPATTGKRHNESVIDGIPDTRPSPGWYTCCDYPAYIRRVYNAVKKVKPEAEVIINTYNWGYMPLEDRKKFLAGLPKDVTVHATYDIFRLNRRGDLSCPTMDYSISAADPGFYFTSEVETAAELGIKNVRVTSNLAGASWDFGTVPYVPVPFRWAHRMQILKKYLKSCGVTSFYDNHHYGWWPNPCNELAKEIFASDGSEDVEQILSGVAIRDYGREAAAQVVETWRTWSNAMDHYVGTNEDQYGPWRVGPSYPFIFQPNISRVMANKELKFPTAPHAHFGYCIIKTFYTPYENINQSPGPLRYPVEIKELEKMLEMWQSGLDGLSKVLPLIPENKKDNGELLFALGKFIRNSIRTTLNMKKWWILNMELQTPSDRNTMLAILDRIEALAQEEIANVKDTIEVVQRDSRLGWEPSMEYVCDQWHLEWKLRQMKSMLIECADYRKMILL